MKLKVGDVVEFRNYEDMTDDERMSIVKYYFPSSGKVKEINVNDCDRYFRIAGSKLIFSNEAVARVISDADDVDINSLNSGDEVLARVTVKKVYNTLLQVEPAICKTDVINILKRKEEHFIVKEDHYGMYVYDLGVFTSNKEDAKIYKSRDEANEVAADMYLNAWEVIPYGD